MIEPAVLGAVAVMVKTAVLLEVNTVDSVIVHFTSAPAVLSPVQLGVPLTPEPPPAAVATTPAGN